ncbi:TRAP transporter small permease [Roseospira visakhapatnamensis]|uniref:TRAP transporter small permease protein n=1 Tax=Roseospira visakhapatnamensis TaxID=390880 RepID=A0A7W6RFK3_9PROT|nr:TRAP transporter small permease [Roseospira visakhapatnamensis]MBB4267655.1 TRAP-type C4-dicarboxylate transport system permease small subunit [Roseospira visakhapatnamensis]
MRALDQTSHVLGQLAAWLFVAIGLMVSYDVFLRYVFNAPTKWALEISEFLLLWATYLAAASVLRQRQNIRITLLYDKLGATGRRLCDSLALVIIAVFSGVVVAHGIDIVGDSIAQGRRTSTMLQVPKWMTEVAIPVGFGLLLAQALVELGRLWTGTARDRDGAGDGHGRGEGRS